MYQKRATRKSREREKESFIQVGCSEDPLWLFMPFATRNKMKKNQLQKLTCVLCLNVGFSEKGSNNPKVGLFRVFKHAKDKANAKNEDLSIKSSYKNIGGSFSPFGPTYFP